MTARDKWYFDNHLKRLRAREERLSKPYMNVENMISVLRELYGCILDDKDEVKLNLINRYEFKVSKRLIAEREELIIKGKENSSEYWKTIVSHRNPFLDSIRDNKKL